MILSGTLLLPTPDNTSVRLSPGSLEIHDHQITAVHEGDTHDRPDLGGAASRYLITPAFTDTHLHLPQFDILGAHGLTLLDWLNTVTFPAEARWADPAFAEAATHRAIDQLFAHGTTSICANATVHHDAAMRALAAASERRMRARIGQVLMDRQAPDNLIRPADQLLAECRDTLESQLSGARVTSIVTPRFAVTCSEKLLLGCGELAREHDAFIQTHLAETQAECDRVRQLFYDDYVNIYAKFGLLTPRSLLAHGIHLSSFGRQQLAATAAVIAHCPTANSFLMSGAMNRQRLLASNVGTCLGSDIGAGYERSMVRVARAMIETHAALHHTPIPASNAWWQITAGNALAAGWPNSGRLTCGADADLLVIEHDLELQNHPDPLAALLFAWNDRWLQQTIADGQVVYSSV